MLVAALVLVAQVVALPIQGEETSLLQEQAGLFPASDDEATVESEVNEAIQHQMNQQSMGDIGEDDGSKDSASKWEKRAAAEINAMSKGAIGKIHADEDDTLSQKFQDDIDQAKKMMASPKKKAATESEIEKEADSALKDPANAKQLQEDAEKAELDMQPGVAPVEFIQEREDSDDLGEADDDADEVDDQFQLMGGSTDDIEKAINARIGQQVSQQLGSSGEDYVDGNALQKFEKDKTQAQNFLSAKVKQSAADKIKAQLAEAQKAMEESQASMEEGDEEKVKA